MAECLPDIELVIPEKVNYAYEACDRKVEEGRGEDVFILYEGRQVTYRELQGLINRVGNALKKVGITKGDAVMIRSPNCIEFLSALFAITKIGAIAVPTQTLYREKEVEYVLNNSDSVLAFSHPTLVDTIESVKDNCPLLKHIVVFGQPDRDQIAFEDFIRDQSEELNCADTNSDDPSLILYTSGSSGTPKGVVRMHRCVYATGPMTSRQCALTPDDVFLHPFELGFGFMYATLSAVIYAGAKYVLFSGRTKAERVLEYIEKYRVTKLSGVPSMFRIMLGMEDLETRYDLSSLKYLMSGGEVLPAETYTEMKERLGVECFDGLGQTECNGIIFQRPTFPVRKGSMGKPYPGAPVAIFDENGNWCPPNKEGQLVVRDNSPILFKEYKKMPEKWAEVHKFPGWYATGDMAYYDEDGYYYWTGRVDALIKSRGYLVSPNDIEDTLLEMPEILEVAAVASPDPKIGNRIKVFVTLRSGHEPNLELAEKFRDHTRKRIAPYKVPKDIEFTDELPKTNSGKVFRRKLAELEMERYKNGESHGYRF